MALFQPAEELGDGARRMVDDGLAGIVGGVDVALAQHVLPGIAGSVGTRTGPVLSAADSMREPCRSAQMPATGLATSIPTAIGVSLMPAVTASSPLTPWK